jgi:RimJ/RimL family protein N-acetyltransferase
MSKIDEYHRVWMLECEEKVIGTVILQKINHEHDTGQLIIIFENGDVCKSKALFKGVCTFVADYAFEELGLQRLQVEVLENDLKLKKVYKGIGFLEEGLLRSKYEIKDKCYDAYVMSMLKIEWARRKK